MNDIRLTLPSVEVLRPNFVRLNFGALTVWYSYKTPIAFRFNQKPRVVRRNNWGPTTGKHLNAIDDGDHKSRVSDDEFMTRWAMMADLILEQGINLLTS